MNLQGALEQYSKKIVNGEIIACTKHVWACQRFLSDLQRQGTKDFPYIFKPEKAQRFIDWTKFFKHTKGVLAGKRKQLTIWEQFIVSNIYGWYHTKTGYRRFNKAYIQVARKNAKSQELSLIATYELMVFLNRGEEYEVSEVYCAANNKEQAKIIYNEAKLMLDRCEELNGKWKESYRKIEHLKTKSIFRALSKEDRKSGDGLNPQCGILDEYHSLDTSEIYDVLDSGMGARKEPLIVIITTAGFNLNSPCYRIEYKLSNDILDPSNPVELDSTFVMICELETNTSSEPIEINGKTVSPGDLIDDINDEKNWIKANPIICSYPEGVDYLRKKLKEAKIAPDKMRNFLTKHMNVWVNQKDGGYMNLEKWEACKIDKFPDLSGNPCFVGIDLSAKIDLTSVAWIFPIDDKYYIKSHSFIPESRLNERMQKDKMPFDLWVEQGWITLISGDVVDYRQIKQYCIETANENRWYEEEYCIDPWGSIQISNDLIEEGKEVVDIIQGIKTLSEPTKAFREEVYKGNVFHDGNPVLSWAIGNAIVDNVDRNENIILSKKKSTDRIDPIAATINAFVRAMVSGSGYSYNTRDMRGFNV